MRAISILFVMIRHFEITHLVSANLGVTIFFFISGFIITRVLVDEHVRRGSISLRNFFWRRLIRLWPALWAMMAAMIAYALIFNLKIDWHQVAAGLFYYMNYYSIMLRESQEAYTLPINPLWSLAGEEHFYLIYAPLLIAFIGQPKRLYYAVCGLIVAALIWRVVNVYALGFTPKYNYFATEARIDSILYGCALALAAHFGFFSGLIKRCDNVLVILAAGAALMGTIVLMDENTSHTFRYSLQGICLFVLFAGTIFGSQLAWARGLLSLPPFVFVGKISYSLYLWHLPCIFATNMFLPAYSAASIGLASVLSFALATASYTFIEKPLLKYRHAFSR